MLAWYPPAGSKLTVPLSDSHSLVRLLGAGPTANGTAGRVPSDGDVVRRDDRGVLQTQWELLW